MERPIRETPILYGEDARRFEESEVNPKSWTVDYDANLVNLY